LNYLKMKKATKKVMIFGTFDILHKGHLNFFKQARKRGDFLIAVIARDKTVLKIKSKLPINKERTRAAAVKKSGFVDKVVLGGLKNKYKIIKKIRPDVICLGYDQKAFIDGLKNFRIPIIKLKSFKPEVYKTSKIRKQEA